MGLQIEGATGNGYGAAVTSENRLQTECVTISQEHHVNADEGEAYNLIFSATPTASGNCFLYIKNSDEKDLSLEGMILKIEADEYIDLDLNTAGTPIAGNDITPANLNTSSGKQADGTFQSGNNITGLSGGTTSYRFYHASSKGSTNYNFDQDIVLRKNGVMILKCETGTTFIGGTLIFYFHDAE